MGAEEPTAPGRAARGRAFELYLSGATASWAGVAIADVLFLWLVFTRTGSTLALAYVAIAEALPAIAIGLPAGILADRYDRRSLLIIASLLQAAPAFLIALTLGTVGFSLPIVVLLIVAFEVATVLWGPASTALLPTLVDSAALESANGLVQGLTAMASTLGAAGAAALLLILRPATTFVLDGAVFLLAALVLAVISSKEASRSPTESPKPRSGLRRELAEVVAYLRAHRSLVALTGISIASGFFIEMFSPFLVVFTVRVLDDTAGLFGYLVAAYTAGFFLGSVGLGRSGVVAWYGRFLFAALTATGLLLAVLVSFPSLAAAVLVLAGIGALLGLVVTGFGVLIQRTVPSALLGRYLGLDQTLVWATAPLGILAGGVLMAVEGTPLTFGVAAAGLVGTGIVALLLRSVRSVGVSATEIAPA